MPNPSSLIDEWTENLLRDLDPDYAREDLWDRLGLRPQPGPQEAFLKSDADITIFGGAAGGGKLLALDTPIPTPEGWTTMGGIKAGDAVFDETGKPCKVVVAHPVDPSPECYRLAFDDGSTVDAGADHLWWTFTAADLSALSKRTDEYRKKRRETRPSSVSGRKSDKFAKALTLRNKANAVNQRLPPPTGAIRTTKEIAETLTLSSGRRNHAIPVAGALRLPGAKLPLDPYLLGAWLGDGTSTAGAITTADQEIVSAFRGAGFVTKKYQDKYGWGINGLRPVLNELGVFGNKHVPETYLRSSYKQRLALLQGLMDTDGHACESGSVEFSSSNLTLAEGVVELIRSLGSKASIATGRATLNGKDCGPKYRIKWAAPYPAFRLKRKLSRQKRADLRRTTKFRYIVSCEPIPSVPMRCITVDSPSKLYLCGRSFIPTHNTFGELLDPLQWIHVPGFGAVIFRRTTTQVRAEGGLWDESQEIYPRLGGVSREQQLEWRFPSGAAITFAHMEWEKNRLDWQGSQICLISFDELTHFSKKQFFYMLSRNRSTCGVKPRIRATCNPDADSWVAEFIEWWIDPESGYADPDRAGKLRWFVQTGDELVWADSAEELAARYPDAMPTSVTFIPAKLDDNPALTSKDPGYRARLMALDRVERERLANGNWKIRPVAGMYFRREWFEIVDQAPAIDLAVRYWDFAGSRRTTKNKDPDWTVGLLLGYKEPYFYILDAARLQESPGTVMETVAATAAMDGPLTPIIVEQEPGSASLYHIDNLVDALPGFAVVGRPSTGSKILRAKPVSSAAEHGKVILVRGEWNRTFLQELEYFPDGAHDDQVDALSGAHASLVELLKALGSHEGEVVTYSDEVSISPV